MIYFAFVYGVNDSKVLDYVFLVFQLCCIVVCSLLVIQTIIVNTGGSYFLHIHFIESGSWYTYRNGRLRILENENIYLFAYIVSLVYLKCDISRMRRAVSLVCIIMAITYNMYVSQTRMILISEVLLFVFMLFYKSRLTVKRVVITAIVVPIIIWGLFEIQDILVNALIVSVSDKSVTIRLLEYSYFLKAGYDYFPFGIGYKKIGILYYFGDVGIVGVIGKYGYLAAAIIIFIYLKMFNMRKKSVISENDGFKLLLYLLIFNILMLLILSNPLDGGHMQVFAIEMATVECISRYNIKSLETVYERRRNIINKRGKIMLSHRVSRSFR